MPVMEMPISPELPATCCLGGKEKGKAMAGSVGLKLQCSPASVSVFASACQSHSVINLCQKGEVQGEGGRSRIVHNRALLQGGRVIGEAVKPVLKP